jgi:aminoglycoside 2'-N-acetyltransferase I
MRRVCHRGRWLRTGYVEHAAVRADARRRGLGGRVMTELERIADRAYDLAALSASDDGAALYTARGWRSWPGEVHALSPLHGDVRLPEEEGSTYVRTTRAALLDPAHPLLFDWRDGDVL